MSPEQAVRPRDVTVRSGIFSLGITLFELFTGRILSSPHHVFEVMNARLQRNESVTGKFLSMDVGLDPNADVIAELVLDMHLRGHKGRPSIETVLGRLTWFYANLTGVEWKEEFL